MAKLARDQIIQYCRRIQKKNKLEQQQQHQQQTGKTFMRSPDFHGFSILPVNRVTSVNFSRVISARHQNIEC